MPCHATLCSEGLVFGRARIGPTANLVHMVLHVLAQMSHFLILERVEVVAALAPTSQLRQVVVKRLFRDSNLISGILQTQPLVVEVFVVIAIVEATPLHHFLDHVGNGALLRLGSVVHGAHVVVVHYLGGVHDSF